MKTPNYISVARAAEILGVTRRTIFRKLDQGLLTRYAMGGVLRLDENELHAVMAAGNHPTTTTDD
ncbi:excisionase family DNA-binding protein [Corynebacterium neomassiliense]|uniref:excisionase family DNA-binding protein n=1 Tax=Corynebacterium neomassiliense TaxID=2079482 RepID=UPI001030E4DF